MNKKTEIETTYETLINSFKALNSFNAEYEKDATKLFSFNSDHIETILKVEDIENFINEEECQKRIIVFELDSDNYSSQLSSFNEKAFEKVKDVIGPIFRTVISNLLRNRDYLALQLDFEFGNISDQEFEELEKLYLVEADNISCDNLKKCTEFVMKFTNKVFNSEEISTMFNCTTEAAEDAIGKLLIEKQETIDGSS